MKELTKAEKEYIVRDMLNYLTNTRLIGDKVTLKNLSTFHKDDFELATGENYYLISNIIKKLSG